MLTTQSTVSCHTKICPSPILLSRGEVMASWMDQQTFFILVLLNYSKIPLQVLQKSQHQESTRFVEEFFITGGSAPMVHRLYRVDVFDLTSRVQNFKSPNRGVLAQFPQHADLLEMNWPSQLESSQLLCEMRYTTNPAYAAVAVETSNPINTPLTSERKKWSKRYPLITITSPATVHAALYSTTAVKSQYQILIPNFNIKEKIVMLIISTKFSIITTIKLALNEVRGDAHIMHACTEK